MACRNRLSGDLGKDLSIPKVRAQQGGAPNELVEVAPSQEFSRLFKFRDAGNHGFLVQALPGELKKPDIACAA